MREWFLLNYNTPHILNAWLVWYGDKFNVKLTHRAKRKIRSIQYYLKIYKHEKKQECLIEAMVCFDQLKEELGINRE